MPVRYFALLLACVIAAAAVTIWIAVSIAGYFSIDQGAQMAVIPVVLVAYGVWRGIDALIAKRQNGDNPPPK